MEQPLYSHAADEVLVDDFGDVGDCDTAVPDLLGVHHDADPVLALVKTTGVVCADDFADAAGFQLCLQLITDLGAPSRLAAALGVIGWALVDADEHVTLKARHEASLTRLEQRIHR